MTIIIGTNNDDAAPAPFPGSFLELVGTDEDDSIYGLAGNDVLLGGGGNDYLDGGEGEDRMEGSVGSDTYVVDNLNDRIYDIDFNIGDVDTVFSSVSWSDQGFGQIENINLTGTDDIDALGTNSDNIINGNSGANSLHGGGGGNDIMNGGDGNDTYYVDSGDVVTESSNDFLGGVDLVNSSVSFNLGFGLENLTLDGSDNIDGTGNENNNVIIGNQLSNVIDGGIGADTMLGDYGDDTYIVDNIGDIVSEVKFLNDIETGIDTVNASVNFHLGFGLENLNLTGLANCLGIGNSNGNIINGNGGNNVLSGGIGNDEIKGGLGNDYINGGAGNDLLDGGVGVDRVSYGSASAGVSVNLGITIQQNTIGAGLDTLTSIENLTGSRYDDALIGNSRANNIAGGFGNDTLTGGAGNDKFLFNGDLEAVANLDTITDFNIESDTILLQNAIFTNLTTAGVLATSSFISGMGVSALDSNDFIVYDTTDGTVYYDADGNGIGEAIAFVKLTGIPNLTMADFVIV